MKKIMILGASIGQLAIIKKAKELGYKVAIVDYDNQAVGIHYSDKFYNASTINVEEVIKAALDFQPDGITTIQTDMPMRAIAAVCEKMNLTGINQETALKATDKEEMIHAFEKHNIACPWHYSVIDENDIKNIINKISFPCIFKPSDNSGSRGVSLVKDASEIEKAFTHSKVNSKSGRIIIEEFMIGPEVSVEILMIDGKEYVLAVTDKLTTGSPHFVELGHSEQSKLDLEEIELIKCLAVDAMKAVGITNGPGHVEIILTKDGPKIVELGARLGGDFITSDLVPLSTGIDMMGAVLQIACGEKPNIQALFNKGSAIRFIIADEGTITSINGLDEAKRMPGVVKVELLKKIGDKISPLCSSLDRLGYVITQSDNVDEAISQCESALKKIKIEVAR